MVSMNQKTPSARRLKGSVLFTVLVVMLVLIVFLTGALGLASASNRRAQNTFTSSQAQYTARSVVDGAVSALRNVKEFKDWVDAIPEGNSQTLSGAQVTLPTDGLHYGTVNEVIFERESSQYRYDETSNSWQEVNIVKITATVTAGVETSSFSTYLTTAVQAADTPGEQPTSSGGYPAVTVPGSISAGPAISVLGGCNAGFTLDLVGSTNIYAYSLPTTGMPVGNANTKNVLEAPYAVFSNSESTGGAGCIYSFPRLGAGIVYWGDLALANNASTQASPAVYAATSMNYTDIPYFYVEGKFTMTKPFNADATKKIPLNIFAGYVDLSSDCQLGADVYCLNDKQTSNVHTDNVSSVISVWTGNLVKGTDTTPKAYTMNGFYTLGNLTVGGNGASFDGDVIVDGIFNATVDVKIKGDLVVKGAFLHNDKNITVTGKIYSTTDVSAVAKVTAAAKLLFTDYAGYKANKTQYDSMRASYKTANVTVWNGITSHMSVDAVTKDINDGAFPWYMQKTWILGLFDDSDPAKMPFGFYKPTGATDNISRQIIETPNDIADAQYASLVKDCKKGTPVYTFANSQEITAAGTYIPTAPYLVVPKTTTSLDGPIVVDMAKSTLDTVWLIIEGDLSWANGKHGGITMNDLDANGKYLSNKTLNIMLKGNLDFNGDNETADYGCGINTTYYLRTLYGKNATFYIPTGISEPAGATKLECPNIYVYSDVWPYTYADGKVTTDLSKNHTISFSNSGNQLMTCFMLAPGLTLSGLQKATNSQLDNCKVYYNGTPVYKENSTNPSGFNIGWVGCITVGAANGLGSGGRFAVLAYSTERFLDGTDSKANPLAWFEEYQQSSNDAY